MKSGGGIKAVTDKYCSDLRDTRKERCEETYETKDPCAGVSVDTMAACYGRYDEFIEDVVAGLNGDQKRAFRKIKKGTYNRELASIPSQAAQAAPVAEKPTEVKTADVKAKVTAAAQAEISMLETLCQKEGTQAQCVERLDSALAQLASQYGENVAELSKVIQYDTNQFSASITLTNVNGQEVQVTSMAGVKQLISNVVGDFIVSGGAAKATVEALEGLCSEKIMTEPGDKSCAGNIRDIKLQILKKSGGDPKVVEAILGNPHAEHKGLNYELTVDGKKQTFKTLDEVMGFLRRTYGVEDWSIRVGYGVGTKMGATDGGESEIQSASDNFNGHPNVQLGARRNFRLRPDSWWSAGADLNFSRIKLEGGSVREQEARPWMISFGPAFEYNYAFDHDWNALFGGALLLSKATDDYLHSTEGGLMANYWHLTLQGMLGVRYRINRGNAVVGGLKLSMGTSVVQRALETFDAEDPDIDPRQDYLRYGPGLGGFFGLEF
ncbi:MAG: hypothetical protein HY609_04400 [Deltaproteobacteria bacterium]|nr:hypothetical protein [Deltaproteobacteria bacterium]MBI4224151.1 hypothetical protein [Deltaproteobacteria bacterium]